MPRDTNQSKFALAFSAGATISSGICGGTILGYFLDRWLNTSPWLSVTGLIIGTVGGFLGLFRIMSRLSEREK